MSVYIGTLGAMVATPCLSGLKVTTEDRIVLAGGAGTLSPRRATTWGRGARTWTGTIDYANPGELAALETLYDRQAIYGAEYRMLACNATEQNALTPWASTDFTGWTGGFTVSTLYTASAELVGGGTVLYPSTPLEARTPLEGGPPPVTVDSVAAVTVTASPSSTLMSPIVPVRPGYPVTLGIFALGTVTLSARWVNAAGSTISTQTLVTTTHAGLQRLTPSTIAPADAAGVQIVVTGGTRYAWPSVTWTAGPRRFTTGRGAESVVLSPVTEDVILAAPRNSLSAFTYTITEEGV